MKTEQIKLKQETVLFGRNKPKINKSQLKAKPGKDVMGNNQWITKKIKTRTD